MSFQFLVIEGLDTTLYPCLIPVKCFCGSFYMHFFSRLCHLKVSARNLYTWKKIWRRSDVTKYIKRQYSKLKLYHIPLNSLWCVYINKLLVKTGMVLISLHYVLILLWFLIYLLFPTIWPFDKLL